MNARAISGQRRIDAQLKGEVFYLPATRCPKGHQLKYSATGTCVECESERKKVFRHAVRLMSILARVYYGLPLVDIPRARIDICKKRGYLTSTLQLTELGKQALENARRRFRKSGCHTISVQTR